MTAVKERIVGGAVRAFGKRAEVCEVAALSPRLRRLRFAGDAVAQMTWSAGDKIKLRVGDGVMRSYTPARVDARTGTMDIVFHLHGNGPAAAWAAAAQRGDTAWFFGPKTSMPAVGRDIAWALFFGDETALGLGLALAEAHGDRADVSGAIELDRADLGAVAALGSTLTPVARDAEYGDALLRWLAERELPTGG
ncbi:MAG: siderophore-interacting protein, partial [Myxococcota bacterium]